ncbi:MAG: peroxiredoxin family protein, partial [Verrucomicrobiales bacterium]
MRKQWILIGALLMACVQAGTPRQAEAVKLSYEKSLEAWKIKLRLAQGEAERGRVMSEQPKPELSVRRMWAVISPQLSEEWTIEPAAWFLRMASPLVELDADGLRKPAFRPEIAKVQQAVAQYHLSSRRLAPMCMALVACNDKTSLNLLRRIEKTNPDKKVAGVAALGLAMMAKDINDEPRIMRERLTMLRKAIIDAADVEVNGVTVAKLAEEELYIIHNLSKGRPAPDLNGRDSGGRAMSLSSYEGKVVVLVFWNSGGEGPDAVIDWMRALRADPRFAGNEFEVVGVNN